MAATPDFLCGTLDTPIRRTLLAVETRKWARMAAAIGRVMKLA